MLYIYIFLSINEDNKYVIYIIYKLTNWYLQWYISIYIYKEYILFFIKILTVIIQ